MVVALELVHAKQLMIANEQQDSVSLSIYIYNTRDEKGKGERGVRASCLPKSSLRELKKAGFLNIFFDKF